MPPEARDAVSVYPGKPNPRAQNERRKEEAVGKIADAPQHRAILGESNGQDGGSKERAEQSAWHRGLRVGYIGAEWCQRGHQAGTMRWMRSVMIDLGTEDNDDRSA